KIHVVRNHQIEKTVAVIVTERSACGPPAVRNSCFLCDVCKRSISVVVKEFISAEASQIDVGPAVVVVIPDGPAHRKTWRCQTGFSRHVRKGAIVIVMIERAPPFLPLKHNLHGGSIGKKNAGTPVAVKTNKKTPATHRFDHVLACR